MVFFMPKSIAQLVSFTVSSGPASPVLNPAVWPYGKGQAV